MKTHDLVSVLREVVSCYDSLNQGGDAHNEIIMWRNKFLSTLPKIEGEAKEAFVKSSFLTVHCANFKLMSVEEILKKIEESYKKDENPQT